MIIAHNNLLKDATLSATNEHSSYPVYNLFHKWKKQVFRATASISTITVQLDGLKTINSLFVLYHNLVDIEVRFYNTGALVDTWTDFVKHKEVIADAIELDLTAPTDIWVGLIFVGDSLYFRKSADQDIPLMSTDVPTFSSDGQVAGRRGSVLRGGTIEIPFLTELEREQLEEVYYSCGMVEPIYLDLWQESQFPALYGVFASDLDVSHHQEGDTVSFSFKEVN